MSEESSLRSSPGALPRHRNDIDGMRAVAVLSVLAFHTQTKGFSGGFAGVDVFFVLSGYLICSILLREIAQGSYSIGRFYERRCKRILPALIVVLLFCAAAAMLLLSPVETAHLGKGIWATALSASNILFYLQGSYFDHSGERNPLLMTWSLAVEEQFYIVFPLLLVFLYRRARRGLFPILCGLALLSFAFSVFCEFRHPELNFYLPITRAWELGAGVLLAVWQAGRPTEPARRGVQNVTGALGLLMLAATIALYTPGTRFPGFEAVPPVLGAVLLLASPEGWVNRALGWKPLGGVGLISYSLYLWHWPLLSFANIASPTPLTAPARAGLMALACVLATFSYLFIETPFRTARSTHRGRLLLGYGLALSCVGCIGVGLVKSQGAAFRSPELARVERSLEMEREHDCINSPSRGPILTGDCFPAQAAGASGIALLGDSHAEALAPALRDALTSSGRPLIVLAGFSCPPLAGVTRVIADEPQHASSCARFNQTVLKLLAQRTDVRTVILTGAWAMVPEDRFVRADDPAGAGRIDTAQSAANLVAGIDAEVKALEAQGKQVVVFDDVPSLPFTPLDRVRAVDLPARRRVAALLDGQSPPSTVSGLLPRGETISPAAETVRTELLRLAQADSRLTVVDTKDILCTATNCRYAESGNLFYTDNNHVSRFGAQRILSATGLTETGALFSERKHDVARLPL